MRFWLDRLATPLLVLEPALALGAVALLLVAPWHGWIALLALLAPWTGRLWLQRLPRPVPVDAAVVLFLAGGLVGLWAAYDQAVAVPRFYGIAGAGMLYALVRANGTSKAWRQAIAALLVLAGVGLAAFFTTQYRNSPNTKFAAIDQARSRVAALVPQLPGERPHPSAVASYLVMVLPLAVAMAVRRPEAAGSVQKPIETSSDAPEQIGTARRRQGARAASILWWAAAGIMAAALVLTESRGGWLAAGGVAVLWLLSRWRHGAWIGAVIVSAGAGLFGAAVLWGGCGVTVPWLEALSGAVPVSEGSVSRLSLYRDMVQMVRDYPFLGLGLGGMPLVYSYYYLMVGLHPYLFHAHNLPLQLWLDQGALGIAVYTVAAAALGGPVLARAWGKVLQSPVAGAGKIPAGADRIAAGAAWGALAIAIDGVWNAGLYPERGVVLLLVPLALASGTPARGAGAPKSGHGRAKLAGGAILAAAIAVALAQPQVQSRWLSGLGAIAQGRADLAGAQAPRPASLPGAAEELYRSALALDPENARALGRLGGMRLDRREYPAALGYLETAYLLEPCSAATRQMLASADLALGESEKAYQLWRTLPNARQRLEIQAWRFRQAGDNQSARAAEALLARLRRDGM